MAGVRVPLYGSQVRPLGDRLYELILSGVAEAVLNGHPEERLPNSLNVSFPGIHSTEFQAFVRERVACSTGCGCHAGKTAQSSTLLVIGRDGALATAALRLTIGVETAEAEIDDAGLVLTSAVKRLLQRTLHAAQSWRRMLRTDMMIRREVVARITQTVAWDLVQQGALHNMDTQQGYLHSHLPSQNKHSRATERNLPPSAHGPLSAGADLPFLKVWDG